MPEARLNSVAYILRSWREADGACRVEYRFSLASADNPGGTALVTQTVDAALFARLGKGALVKVSFDPHNPDDARIDSILKPVSHP